MTNCLICKHVAYDPVEDKYWCWARLVHIDILLEPEECKTYKKSEEI
mgnify:CR=1 FL=1